MARTGPSLADGTTSHTMKRADLYQAIRDQAIAQGIVVEHSKRQVDVEPAGDGVRALFEDGSDATGGVDWRRRSRPLKWCKSGLVPAR